MIGEDVPDYLNKCFSKEGMVQDNFDHTDVVWMGNDGNMDPDAVIAEYGWGGHSLLFQLISALIAGYHENGGGKFVHGSGGLVLLRAA